MKKGLSLLLAVSVMSLSVTARAGSRSGRITMDFDLSAHDQTKEARLWIPYPESDSRQLISDIDISGDFAEAAVYSDPEFGNQMLFARWEKGSESRKLTFAFTVQRQEVIRRDFPEKEVPWDPADYDLYLAGTRLGPITGPVKELADSITRGRDTVLGKARAIYDWICDNMYRDPKTRGCGEGDVCSLLEKPGGKCVDIHSVYVSLARAAGVPSREVFGIRQAKAAEEDITTWYHCWAEFYLPGYGWVPVDPGDVRKMMLKEDLKLDDPRAEEYRSYFWGGIDAYRVKLSYGRDLTLNPLQEGARINYLMYPFAQVGGKTIDWLDPERFKYSINYRGKGSVITGKLL